MREILFRGWTIGEFSWEYGFLSWLDTPRGRGYFINNKRIDERTLGQFTGMTDKNGTKIFEGDILKIVTFGFNTDAFITSIIWDRNGFKLANGRNLFYFGQSDYTKLDDSIVIGNIHDNKELLK